MSDPFSNAANEIYLDACRKLRNAVRVGDSDSIDIFLRLTEILEEIYPDMTVLIGAIPPKSK